MGRRTILLITSILIAAVGTALVAVYVRTADARARQDQTLVKVLVATAPIAPSTQGSQASLGVKQMPSGLVQGLSLVTDRKTIDNQVAQSTIYTGTPIQTSMFGATTPSTSLIGLGKNKVGVTIQVSDPGRVAGFARAGSTVALYATSAGGNNGQNQKICLVLSPVRIITLGGQVPQQGGQKPGTDQAPAAAVPQTLVTVELDPGESRRIILASQTAQLYMALLGPSTNVPAGCLNLSDLYGSGG